MLNIYCADALIDKEKFIFDRIDPGRKTLIIVPDQYSLQAEQDALRHTGRRALTELMVTDFNALGHKVVHALEGRDPKIIDKYGRHILLTVLIERLNDDLKVFRGRRDAGAFADQMNTMISEFKRYEVGPEDLEEAISHLQEEEDSSRGGDSYLILKLEDMLRIYRAYEEAIEDVYRDAEDYITYYADRIPGSDLVRGADVWIYGFDTFTPKNLRVIRGLLQAAASVSVVLSCETGQPAGANAAQVPAGEGEGQTPAGADAGHLSGRAAVRALTRAGGAGLFSLSELMMQRLENEASECGRESRREVITGPVRRTVWNRTDHMAADTGKDAGPETAEDSDRVISSDRIRLVQTGNSYEEAESAAAFIRDLVRDRGFHYGDIAVLCNDMDGRGRTLQRVFERWDIPAFADQKRKVLHQPVVAFLLSFLDVLTSGYRTDSVLGMIKSGLMGWEPEDEDLLENYLKEFRIRGNRWKKEFTWTGGRYTEEELKKLNEMRAFLVSASERMKDAIGRRNTAAEKIHGLTAFLEEDFHITDRIEQTIRRQQDLLLAEGAAETAQIWNAVCGIFGQIVNIVGEEKISNVLLRDMITAGLDSLEIGLVPANGDSVIIGTLQRSRPGHIRALLVTGANAGLLPLDITDEGLLSRREKEQLEEMKLEFAGREEMAQKEEQLAIYRMFSLPSDVLYVSCSESGEDGSMIRPSDVFRKLQEWQPEVEGPLSTRPMQERLGSRRAAAAFLADAMREGEEADWDQVLKWYERNDARQAERIRRGVHYSNKVQALGEKMADALYRGDGEMIEASASRLEKFSGCPFAHFIQYGLRAREQRLFEVGGREIGDIYHQCMMEFSRALEQASDEGSTTRPTWSTITEEECRMEIARILREGSSSYKEGLFSEDGSNQFRMERITDICGDVAWALVEQVRQGTIRKMFFEESFGRKRRPEQGSGSTADKIEDRGSTAGAGEGVSIPPVLVEAGGQKVRISGTIDRLDIMDTGEGHPDAVRIVDYKTGNNSIRPEEIRAGYKLQLMIYMDAALQGTEASEPAGVFYFKINEFQQDERNLPPDPASEDPDEIRRKMRKHYRMEGIVVNDALRIGAMDEAVDGSAKAESNVIPVKYEPKKEAYAKTGGGTLLTPEEFLDLMEETNRQVERICGQLCRGEISIAPKRENKKGRDGKRFSACTYCDYKSICGFDPAIKGCNYIDVPG